MAYSIEYIKRMDDFVYEEFVQYLKIYHTLSDNERLNYISANTVLEGLVRYIARKESIDFNKTYNELLNDNKIYSILCIRLNVDITFLHTIRKNRNTMHGEQIVNNVAKEKCIKNVIFIINQVYNYYFKDKPVNPSYSDVTELISSYNSNIDSNDDVKKIKEELLEKDKLIDDIKNQTEDFKQSVLTEQESIKKELEKFNEIITKTANKKTINPSEIEQIKANTEKQNEELQQVKTLFEDINTGFNKIDEIKAQNDDFQKSVLSEQESLKQELLKFSELLAKYSETNSFNPLEIEQIKSQLIELKKTNSVQVREYVSQESGKVASLIRRAELFIEDGEFDRAYRLIDNEILNLDPENAKAYILLILGDNKLTKEEDLLKLNTPLDKNPNYKKALRFASTNYKEVLIKYNDVILENIYNNAISNKSLEQYTKAIRLFKEIISYKDSEKQIEECKLLRDYLNKYNAAVKLLDSGDRNKAIEQLNKIVDYEKSKEKLYTVALELTNNNDNLAINIFKTILHYKDSEKQIENQSKYREALDYIKNKQYLKAMHIFEGIIDYKDSKEKIVLCKQEIYKQALTKFNKGLFLEAGKEFDTILDYKDSIDKKGECIIGRLKKHSEDSQKNDETINGNNDLIEITYQEAIENKKKGEYKAAIRKFKLVDDYLDSKEQIKTCEELLIEKKYTDSLKLIVKKQYNKAKHKLIYIKGYKDANEKIKYCEKQITNQVVQAPSGNGSPQKESIKELNNLIKSSKGIDKIYYKAKLAFLKKQYNSAITYLINCKDYKDSIYLLEYSKNQLYNNAIELKSEGKFVEAYPLFARLHKYEDCKYQANECKEQIYRRAIRNLNQGDLVNAKYLLTRIGKYKDSSKRLEKIKKILK